MIQNDTLKNFMLFCCVKNTHFRKIKQQIFPKITKPTAKKQLSLQKVFIIFNGISTIKNH